MISTNPGGLGNRLKCLLSTMRRDPGCKVYWPINSRCQEQWSLLFKNPIEIKEPPSKSSKCIYTWRLDVLPCDKMPEGFSMKEFYGSETKYRDIDFEYHRIPYQMTKTYLEVLNKLQIHEDIVARVNTLAKNFDSNTISVHIRSWDDDPGRRSKFHDINMFVETLDKYVYKYPNCKFYLVTDDMDKNEIRTLHTRYSSRILNIPKDIALVELLLLSKNPILIGSYISTFTEMAWWLGQCKAEVEIVKRRHSALTLHGLGLKYGTDKVIHGFLPAYEAIFSSLQSRAQRVMEIGVFFGASIEMWKTYFTNAVIHGVDSFRGFQGNGNKFDNPEKYLQERTKNPHPRIKLHKVDQHNDKELEEFARSMAINSFDIIIDDASHLMCDQQKTLARLFPLVRPGGYFVIEDIHTSLQSGYDVTISPNNKTLTMVEKYIKTGKWDSVYMNKEDTEYLNNNTEMARVIKITISSITCIIRKKSTVTELNREIRRGNVTVCNYCNETYLPKLNQHIPWLKSWLPENSNIICYGPDDIDREFRTKNNTILSQNRGNGYWLWKPYIILNTLLSSDSQFVMYCDVGGKWRAPYDTVRKYFENPNKWIYALDQNHIERLWSKKDAYIKIGVDPESTSRTRQFWATSMVFRNCKRSIEFVKEWLQYCCDPSIITDSPSVNSNFPEFRENRHDQTVYSLLCKKYGVIPINGDPIIAHRYFYTTEYT